ncbi:MAG: DUF1003 domain-containing protein [Acidimicrobiia bacterium]|nr:DUF1003 domain-containing protein [Acidimicrobiia bacterium]
METHAERVVKSVEHLQGAFGGDAFGCKAEAFARFFGTPRFLIGQTFLVIAWIVVNVVAVAKRWDPYPFILLNLAFSLQAAYAAPLILLAQTRQADRDKAHSALDIKHREDLAAGFMQRQELVSRQNLDLKELLELNTRLTKQIDRLTAEIHQNVVAAASGSPAN